MTSRPRGKGDPIEQEIESALNPGGFIPDRACFSFVDDLDEIAAKVAKLVAADPCRAASLYETFLAASYAKIEELDDSSGSFGQFVTGLYCGWIKARQRGGAEPDETISQLLTWIDNDDYGFCYELEKDAAKVFDRANLAAFVKQIRKRFDAAGRASSKGDVPIRESPEYARRRWGEVLRTLYAARRNITAYVALTEETGRTTRDCLTIATMLSNRRKLEEALSWVERGIDLDKKTQQWSMAGEDLTKLKRNLLTKLGRGNEALAAVWADYREHPGQYTYDDLMKFVPKAGRAAWHAKAIEAAAGSDLDSHMDLLMATKEVDRLAALVRQAKDRELEDLSHFTTEPVAHLFEKKQPDLAARLWRAQGLRIVSAKKSKYYGAALANFESAKRCFVRAGLEAEWQKTVSQVRTDHHRKSGFMAGFERLRGTR